MTRRWLLVLLALAPGLAAAQKPRVRVEFRVVAVAYRDAFGKDTALVNDSGARILADAFNERLRFLTFSTDDTSARRLVVRLEERTRLRDHFDEVGLRVELTNRLGRPDTTYWRRYRTADAARSSVGEPESFLAAFRDTLASFDPSVWNLLVMNLLHRIAIADTAAAVWGPPTAWLLPYRRADLCIGPEGAVLRVHNINFTSDGPEDTSITVMPNAIFEPAALAPGDERFARFRGFIRAKPTSEVKIARDSLQVKAVYMEQYLQSLEDCGLLRVATTEVAP